MRKLRIGIVDLVARAPTRAIYSGHEREPRQHHAPGSRRLVRGSGPRRPHVVCYTGFEDLAAELPQDVDVLFVGAFTQSAQLAYAMSNMFRQRGVVTVLGGPHARCYPEDAARYFDYVLGFTDKALVAEVLEECAPHPAARPASWPPASTPWSCRPSRRAGSSSSAPSRRRPLIKIVPMIGSLGCPYTCSFCIDSTVEYQPLDFAADRGRPEVPAHEAQGARSSGGTTRTSASASTTTWTPSSRPFRPAASDTSPRAACRCSRSRT